MQNLLVVACLAAVVCRGAALSLAQRAASMPCEDGFRCRDSSCISRFDLCDGDVHCLDGSDEKPDVCGNLRCPGRSWRCDYGACVDGARWCDGHRDCADGSDEWGCPVVSVHGGEGGLLGGGVAGQRPLVVVVPVLVQIGSNVQVLDTANEADKITVAKLFASLFPNNTLLSKV